jgi:F0F1-type ATP synthase assembly protein I
MMSPEEESGGEPKKNGRAPGKFLLPPAYDLALRWALTLAVAVLIGFFVGRWLDQKLGTTPLFLLIGIFWGVGGSFYSLYIQVKKLQDGENKKPPETPSSR